MWPVVAIIGATLTCCALTAWGVYALLSAREAKRDADRLAELERARAEYSLQLAGWRAREASLIRRLKAVAASRPGLLDLSLGLLANADDGDAPTTDARPERPTSLPPAGGACA